MTMPVTSLLMVMGAASALSCAAELAVAGAPGDVPPGFSMARHGDLHDFDYLPGAWSTQQRYLKGRGTADAHWIDAPANQHCAVAYLDGRVVVEESRSPTGAPAGLFLFAFDSDKQQWAIHWLNGKSGVMDPPVTGGFSGGRGEFYGEDDDGGRPIKVRIVWTTSDPDHARWEQSFSYDNRTWELNWVSEFTRLSRSCPRA
jgi:hypothetical protein